MELCLLKVNGQTFRGDNSQSKLILSPSEKRVCSKKKEFDPTEIDQILSFKIMLFQYRCTGKPTGSHKSCLPCERMVGEKTTKCIQSP